MRRNAVLLTILLCTSLCAGCGEKHENNSGKRLRDSSSDIIPFFREDEQSSETEESDNTESSEAEKSDNTESSEAESVSESQPDEQAGSDAAIRELQRTGILYAYDSDSECYLVLKFDKTDHYLFDSADYIIRGYDKNGAEKEFYWYRTTPDSCWSEGFVNSTTETSVEMREPGYVRGTFANDYYRYFTLTRNSDGSWDDGEGHTFVAGSPIFNGEAPQNQTTPSNQGEAGVTELYNWSQAAHWDSQIEDGASAYITLPQPGFDTLFCSVHSPGPNPWSVQAKFTDIALHQGNRYRVSFEYKAETYNEGEGYDPQSHHALISFIQNYEPYDPYFEATLPLNCTPFKAVSYEFTMDYPTDYDVFCGFSFGGLGDTECGIRVRNFKIEQIG